MMSRHWFILLAVVDEIFCGIIRHLQGTPCAPWLIINSVLQMQIRCAWRKAIKYCQHLALSDAWHVLQERL